MCYIVALEQNRPKEIAKTMLKYNFKTSVVIKRECGIELLYILKFQRKEKWIQNTSNEILLMKRMKRNKWRYRDCREESNRESDWKNGLS